MKTNHPGIRAMKSLFLSSIGALWIAALLPVSAEVSGERGRSTYFRGSLEPGSSFTNRCEFSVELEPVTFELNTFRDKYKVVRIRVENWRKDKVKLLPDQDTIELQSAQGDVVQGTFNLRARDPLAWDSLSDDVRDALKYPASIPSVEAQESPPGRPAVVYLFAYFPADQVTTVPHLFRYKIQSTGRTVTVEKPGATAK